MICCDMYYMVSPYSWTEDAYDTVPSYLNYDMLWYVLHDITVYLELVCVWYGAIVFKIWYVVIRITWYHRIKRYVVMRITWYHRIQLYVVIRYHFVKIRFAVIPMIWYHCIITRYVVINMKWYHRIKLIFFSNTHVTVSL